ncbi:MAG: hypothetical protein IJH32_07370 [Ruminococcus sp.]|nr:hypothetical protein [Ruminococcus sp.]
MNDDTKITDAAESSGIFKFNTIKLLAILLVITEDFILPYSDSSDMLESWSIFISSFSIPLIIFLTGLFYDKYHEGEPFRAYSFSFLIITGFSLKMLVYGLNVLLGREAHLDLFGGRGSEWLLFGLAVYMLLSYLIRKLHCSIVLILSLTLGLAIGFFPVTDEFYLSKILVFLPFYLLGYYLTPETVRSFSHRLNVKFASLGFMIIYFVMCFRQRDILAPLRTLFVGRTPYEQTAITGCSFYHRLLCYGISAVLIFAVVSCIPNIRVPFLTKLGEHASGAYFWHEPVILLLSYFGLFELIRTLSDPIWKLVLLGTAVVLGLILSLPPFAYPLKALTKAMKKLSIKTNLIVPCTLLLIAIILRIFVQ